MTAVNVEESATRPDRAPGWLAKLVERIIPPVDAGKLTIRLPQGEVVARIGKTPGPDARMVLHRRRAVRRILLDGEAGFSDGYLEGDWSTPDLAALLSFLVANETAFRPGKRASLLTLLRHRLGHALRANTRRGSRRNIVAHYDLGNDFYAAWLDAGMNYSSAIYRGGESLEAAQAAKNDRILELLEPREGQSVLEIGCGWGALAERLAKAHDYTGITLSDAQRDHALRRLAGAGVAHPDIRLMDYRDVSESYDRIVSIEMFEAVGERYWPVYFERLRRALAPGGVAVLQVITIAAARFQAYRRRPDYIQRHIFPGGMLPTVGHVEALAAGNGLAVDVRQDFGGSYAETLLEWRRRFAASWPGIAPLGFDDRFRRMWEYYLAYCETGFRHRTIDVSLFRLRG